MDHKTRKWEVDLLRLHLLNIFLTSLGAYREANDEITRQQNEQTFVKSLVAAMRKSIYNYLNTTNGVMEINHVIHEIEVLDAPSKEVGSTESEKAAASDSMTRVKKKQKTMVKEVFRKYDADGSQSIDW